MPAPSAIPRSIAGLAAAHLAWATVGCAPEVEREAPPPRAIFVAIDALNEGILRRTLTEAEVPTLWRIFDEGSCAAHVVGLSPPFTAPTLAALSTGAPPSVTGVAGNRQHRLPRDAHTVLDLTPGFSHEALRAEPIWVTAGREQVPVAAHHMAQAPGIPGFLPLDGERTPDLVDRRREAGDALSWTRINVVNGYQREVTPHRVFTAADLEWSPEVDWEGLEGAAGDVTPRAFRFESGAGTIHGVVHGGAVYDRVTVAPLPVLSLGVTARVAPAEGDPIAGRELARHFSEPLEIPFAEGRVHLQIRVFELADDGSDLLLYHPALYVVEGNRLDLMAAYDQAVGGWVGNAAHILYRAGAFGATVADGGDGTAEDRYVETAELVTRQFMRGAEWLWRVRPPRLLLDYFPLGDEVDHTLLGHLDPDWPGYDAAVAERVRVVRARVWALVDLRVLHLLGMVSETGGTLFVAGDHGMRATWRQFRPNVALRDAGLLALDGAGDVDLARTRAVSPNGRWVSVNRTAWRNGIVPPGEEDAVIAAVRATLEGVVDGRGERVVVRTFVPGEDPEEAMGGIAGGDVYWELAPGTRSEGGVAARALTDGAPVLGQHELPSDAPDMYTAFCAIGGGFGTGRMPPIRITAIAPTLARFAGIPAPADAIEASILGELAASGTEGTP